MSNIYIPIDYSNLREVIPIGEDIIYSTLMSASFRRGRYTESFITHVLITRNGFAWAYPKKKRKPPVLNYNNWTKVKRIIGSTIWIGLNSTFTLKRMKNDEDKREFKLRLGLFADFILPYVIEYLKECLNNPKIKPRKKRKLEKLIQRHSNRLEKEKKRVIKVRKKYGNK